jgi:hypothetical protein
MWVGFFVLLVFLFELLPLYVFFGKVQCFSIKILKFNIIKMLQHVIINKISKYA